MSNPEMTDTTNKSKAGAYVLSYNKVLPYAEDKLELLLIGKTGNGKSNTGNMILGRRQFEEDSSCESVTKHVSTGVVKFEGRVIKVVDGPGVGDTVAIQDVEKAAELAINSMKSAITLSEGGYHAFLLVVRYGVRFTKEDFECIRLLKNICGEDFVKQFCILVVTHGDVFYSDPKNKKKSFETWCREQTGVFKDLLTECNNRVVLFDNQSKDPVTRSRQITDLLRHIDHLQHGCKRYSFDNFRYTEKSRKIILVKAKEPKVRDEVFNTLGLISSEFNDIQFSEDLTDQKKKTDELIVKIQNLRIHLLTQDNETGTFDDLIKHIDQTINMLESRVTSLANLLEVTTKCEELKVKQQKQQDAFNETINTLLEEQKSEKAKLDEERKIMEIEFKKKEKEIEHKKLEEKKKREEQLRKEKEKYQSEMEKLQNERDVLKENKEMGEKEKAEREKIYLENEQKLKAQLESKVNEITSQMESDKKEAKKMLKRERNAFKKESQELSDKFKAENARLEQQISNTTEENNKLCQKLSNTKQQKKQLQIDFEEQCRKHNAELYQRDRNLIHLKEQNDELLERLQQAQDEKAKTIESRLRELQRRYQRNQNSVSKEEKQELKDAINEMQQEMKDIDGGCCIL